MLPNPTPGSRIRKLKGFQNRPSARRCAQLRPPIFRKVGISYTGLKRPCCNRPVTLGWIVGDSDIGPKRPSGKDELLFDSSTKGRHAFGQHSLREFAGTADHERAEVFVPIAFWRPRGGVHPLLKPAQILDGNLTVLYSRQDVLPDGSRQTREADLRQWRPSRRPPESGPSPLRSCARFRPPR